MNKIHSINNPVIMNGADMKDSDFGVVREVTKSPAVILIGQSVFKVDTMLVCLETGYYSNHPDLYEVEIKNTLTLQRIK